ncbi:MAG: DNA polymerase IV [bacterium]
MRFHTTLRPPNGVWRQHTNNKTKGDRCIMHLDMDAYFASVEQKSNPAIKGKPVIVSGRGPRTVITTASYEAREYGIKTGMTIMEAMKLCPNVIRIEGNLEKYIYTTCKIRDILLGFTDRVEVYSIDEFFLDITDLIPAFGSPENIAIEIKSAIYNKTKLSCSCGLAPNKLLAKLASDMNKPNGLTIIRTEEVPNILKGLPLNKLYGIGRKTSIYLNCLGIYTADELANSSTDLLISHFGFFGHVLKLIGKGIDNSPVHCYGEFNNIKSIGHSFTLPSDTSNIEIIKSYILMLCQKVARRLRKENKLARTVTLTIRYSDFMTFTQRKTVKYFINTISGIYKICLEILNNMGRLVDSVRLLGVSVSSLTDDPNQLFIFEEWDKEKRLNSAIDEINDRFGEFTIKPASLLLLK